MTPAAPYLVFGWGNPSRGDDALGPLFVERLHARLDAGLRDRVDLLTDFQLQVEHVLDMAGRERVLFVDASRDCAHPFETTRIDPRRDPSFTTHSLSPAAVMQVFRDVQGAEPPPCTQLAIRGDRFELGEAPTDAALRNLEQALGWVMQWLTDAPPTGPSVSFVVASAREIA